MKEESFFLKDHDFLQIINFTCTREESHLFLLRHTCETHILENDKRDRTNTTLNVHKRVLSNFRT